MPKTNKNKKDLDILSYSDYRAFLHDYYALKKSQRDSWSFGVWARQLGLKSTSSITKVIKGERALGDKALDKVIDYFSFSINEEQHFRDLVSLEKIKRDPRLFSKLVNSVNQRIDSRPKLITKEEFSFLSNWYCLALREMVKLDTFLEDLDHIKDKFIFNIEHLEIQKAIHLLVKTGLLNRDQNGHLICLNEKMKVSTEQDVTSKDVQNFQKNFLDVAKLAIDQVPVNQREVSTVFYTGSSNDFKNMKLKIIDSRDEIVEKYKNNSGDQVYALQIQCYPILKNK